MAVMETAPSRGLRLACAGLLAALAVLLLPATATAVDSVYWANRADTTIRFDDLVHTNAETPLDLVDDDPCGVAIDPAAERIYWANFATGTIRVADLDPDTTDPPQTLATGQGGPCGVAIDPAADPADGRIYWANLYDNAIRVADLDPTTLDPPQNLATGEGGPLGVAIDPAVDPADGRIYWANFGDGRIRSADLDPTNLDVPQNVVIGEPIQGPHGVAVDPAHDRIYWANFGAGTIRSADLDPLTLDPPQNLATGQGGPTGVAVDRAADRIYWANFGSGEVRFDDLDPATAAADPPQNLATGEGASGPNYPALLLAPAGTGAPVISGGDQAGEELSCSEGDWAPDLLGAFLFRAPHSFAYQWRKDGSDVGGATEATFTPPEPGSYTCRVTAENQAGSTSQTSVPTTITAAAECNDGLDNDSDGLTDFPADPSCTSAADDGEASFLFGRGRPGPSFSAISKNTKRASRFLLYYDPVTVTTLRAYLDGNGSASGSQKVRAVIYRNAGNGPGALVAESLEKTIAAGRPGGFVDFLLPSPVELGVGYYWLGLHSGNDHGVVRYAWNSRADSRRYNLDGYANGASDPFGGDTFSDDQQISIHAIGHTETGGTQ